MERIAEGGASRTLERIRVKRVNAGKLTMQNVLQGWTSMKDWNGDLVLQPFDLFNGELDDADATGDELGGGGGRLCLGDEVRVRVADCGRWGCAGAAGANFRMETPFGLLAAFHCSL